MLLQQPGNRRDTIDEADSGRPPLLSQGEKLPGHGPRCIDGHHPKTPAYVNGRGTRWIRQGPVGSSPIVPLRPILPRQNA